MYGTDSQAHLVTGWNRRVDVGARRMVPDGDVAVRRLSGGTHVNADPHPEARANGHRRGGNRGQGARHRRAGGGRRGHVAALTTLGYRTTEAYALLSGIEGDSIEERVAAALRRAGGG